MFYAEAAEEQRTLSQILKNIFRNYTSLRTLLFRGLCVKFLTKEILIVYFEPALVLLIVTIDFIFVFRFIVRNLRTRTHVQAIY